MRSLDDSVGAPRPRDSRRSTTRSARPQFTSTAGLATSFTALLSAPPSPSRPTPRSDRIALGLGPGTADAETHPASVLCTADEDGFIGDGLREGLGRPDTSRGIAYLCSSGDETFELQAAVTWEITWTGTNGGGRRTVRRHLCVDQAVTGQQIRAALDLRWIRQPHVTLWCPQFTPTAENGLWRRTDSPWVPRCRSAAPRRPGGSSPCHPASERGSPRSSPRARERSDRPADQ